MHFSTIADRGCETTVIVSHGLRLQPYDPTQVLQLSKDIAQAFPNVDVSEFHRDDEKLFKLDGSLDLAAAYLNLRARKLKKTKQRVIALGVSLGGLISGMAIDDDSSKLDSVITISMPTDLTEQPLPDEAKQRALHYTKKLPLKRVVMDCIYGGRDSTVDVDIVDACINNQASSVNFHKIPMMTHRSIGHHKAEIKAILDSLI